VAMVDELELSRVDQLQLYHSIH